MTTNPTACKVCGSPDAACQGAHAGAEPIPVDAAVFRGPGKPSPVATVLADAIINGQATTIRTTPEEAEAHGWPIVGLTNAGRARGTALHKARDVASAGTKARGPSGVGLPLEERTADELYTLAQELELAGRSKLKGDRAALTAAIEAELAKARE